MLILPGRFALFYVRAGRGFFFGESVALDGSTIVAGAPAAYSRQYLRRYERHRPSEPGVDPPGSVGTPCAHAHGEWPRIHPFANGNGRTARVWANWCALRYSLPPFVRLRPRPEGRRYARAAADSMAGSAAEGAAGAT